MSTTWSERLQAAIEARGRLCVGIDPHPSLIASWGFEPTVSGLENYVRHQIEVLGLTVAVFKPQSGLFEAYGAAGVAVLERAVADCKAAGALVILDAKRGDFQPTMQGYARGYLMEESPFQIDALTVSPYLGVGSLHPMFIAAAESGRGLYVLSRTSNPEGSALQLARTGEGATVAQQIVDDVEVRNEVLGPEFGLVIGATHEDLGVNLDEFTGSLLVPGIGAQGATVADVKRRFGDRASAVLPNVSRQVGRVGPDPHALKGAVEDLLDQVRELG